MLAAILNHVRTVMRNRDDKAPPNGNARIPRPPVVTGVARALFCAIGCGAAAAATAAPQLYTIDPAHTYPSFRAPHMGISFWRGKFDKTQGKIWLDFQHHTGRMDVTVWTGSADFGMPLLNEMARSILFDVAKYPTATYKSDSISFKGNVPAEVRGELTLNGVSRPLTLEIDEFKCMVNPMFHHEVCGADAHAELNRTDFGITRDAALDGPKVWLSIQVEAYKGNFKLRLPPGFGPGSAAPPGAPPLPGAQPPPGAKQH
jgi:polyisoprenoid-binding protein YceI